MDNGKGRDRGSRISNTDGNTAKVPGEMRLVPHDSCLLKKIVIQTYLEKTHNLVKSPACFQSNNPSIFP